LGARGGIRFGSDKRWMCSHTRRKNDCMSACGDALAKGFPKVHVQNRTSSFRYSLVSVWKFSVIKQRSDSTQQLNIAKTTNSLVDRFTQYLRVKCSLTSKPRPSIISRAYHQSREEINLLFWWPDSMSENIKEGHSRFRSPT